MWKREDGSETESGKREGGRGGGSETESMEEREWKTEGGIGGERESEGGGERMEERG